MQDYQDHLHITAIDVARVVDITYGEPVLNKIPAKVHVRNFSVPNCTSQAQTTSSVLSLAVTTTQVISWSQTVTTGVALSATINYSSSFPFPGGSAGIQVNRTVAIQDGTQHTDSNTVTSTETVNRSVPPMTEVFGKMRVFENNVSIPFRATIVVDGTVDPNSDGWTRLSQLFSEEQRTFTATGVIEATTASDHKVNFYERKLTQQDCADPNNIATDFPAGKGASSGEFDGRRPVLSLKPTE